MTTDDFTIAPGSRADYAALAHLHYRSGPPATFERIFVARPGAGAAGDSAAGPPAAVLVISRPTLNARWRRLLWPGRFDTPDARARAERLNTELRCIARVVVDPRFRGRGVGTQLVRAYLDDPLTRCTEAVAAMASVCGLFRAAGMREVTLARTARDGALLRELRRAGLKPWELIDARRIVSRPRSRRAAVERALRRWANDARGTRRLRDARLADLIEAAAGAVASPLPMRAYGWDSPDHQGD